MSSSWGLARAPCLFGRIGVPCQRVCAVHTRPLKVARDSEARTMIFAFKTVHHPDHKRKRP